MSGASNSELRVWRSPGRAPAGAETPDLVPNANAQTPNGKWAVGRCIRREWLDELPADDPRAVRSRRELRRVNGWMGHAGILSRALRTALSRHLSLRLAEIGAGDGEFLFRVARRLRGQWRRVDATLVDRQDLLKPETQTRFAQLNWHVRSVKDDVFHWLWQTDAGAEAMVANLFLHHFHDGPLRDLLARAAERTQVFVALEPRRARWPLFCSRLLPLIGCGAVTCHDAAVSVRAGFNGRELTALWPDQANWELTENRAGAFSQLFIARKRVETNPDPLFAHESRNHRISVAQIFNLLYRRIPFCEPHKSLERSVNPHTLPIENRRYGRVKLCATPSDLPGESTDPRGFEAIFLR